MNSIRKKPGRVRRPISAELVDQVLACKASYGSAPNFCACYGISLYIYYRICNENRDRLTILEHERLAKWNARRADRLLKTDPLCQ